MTAVSAFQKFFWGDYLRDTMHLSTEEHGAYLLLIAAYWTRGRAPADDDRQLAAITKLSMKKWIKVRPAVAEFFDVLDGHFFHSRIERDLAEANQVAEKSRKNGASGGRPRKPRNNPAGFQNVTQTKPASESESEDISSTAPNGAAEQSRRRDAALPPDGAIAPPEKLVSRPPDPQPASPQSPPPAAGQRSQIVEACLAAAGPGLADPAKTPSLHLTAPRIAAAIAAGCDLESDILPVIRARTAKARASPIAVWGYFEPAWLDARNERMRPMPPPPNPESASCFPAIANKGVRHDFAEPRTYSQLRAERARQNRDAVLREFGVIREPRQIVATVVG